MNETAIILGAALATIVVLAWTAAGLLAARDRYLPARPNPSRYGPWFPPKWAQNRCIAIVALILMTPICIVCVFVLLVLAMPWMAYRRLMRQTGHWRRVAAE